MMQAQKSACIFYGNRVRYNYFLYSLIHMTAGSFLSSDTDSVESIFHRTVVKKRARMQRGEGLKDEKGYDVVRFIEHGGKCRPAMDYVRGQTLIGRLQTEKKIPKKLLFQWFRMLCTQLDCYHRSKGMQCYRYLSPYSVIVTREEKLLLLDLSVPGNGFVMKKMQIPAVRAHFVMPAGKKRSGMAVGIDLYGLGKLFQFMLAYTSVAPPLTWKEEFMMSLVIQKCTGENGKKTYREFDQILRELPRGDRRKSCFRKIKKAL